MAVWTTERLPDLTGKTVVVTGANSGIGFEAAAELAAKNAAVILACRNADKAKDALAGLRERAPNADADFVPLDLADLSSVRAFSNALHASHDHIDILINNAGVMAIPKRQTKDGFEMQLGTNHLGHFALTGQLLDLLLKADAPRVVTVSSTMHKPGKIHFDDLMLDQSYSPMGAYAQSKLANLLFTYELDRRFKNANSSAISVGCHPGWAATNLQAVGPRMRGSKMLEKVMNLGNNLLAQDAAGGALPTLFAAAEPLSGGEYVGPSRMFEMVGPPKLVQSTARARDEESAKRLWEMSEQLTGVSYAFN